MNELGKAGGALALFCAATAAGVRYAVVGTGAQVFGASRRSGPGVRRSVALTFDDGPSVGSLELARYLAEEGVRATFFLCGANVLRHPEIARALHLEGHELGNHTFSHARLCPRLGWKLNILSPAAILKEFATAQAAIVEATGAVPHLLRAPYGMRWWGVGAAQRRLGLMGVMWTVIAHDWEWESHRVVEHVMSRVSPGGIVCLHDGRDTRADPDISETLRAVRTIVPRLKALGYQFETVSEILKF